MAPPSLHLRRSLRPFTVFLIVAVALSNHRQSVSSSSSSSFDAALHSLQQQLGYEFKSIDLLRRAMTHASYSGENYRALSILGLGAIQASVALGALRDDVDASAEEVSGRVQAASDVHACAAAGNKLGLAKVVRVSARTNATEPTVVCGAFRAVFGGIALDTGKVDAAGEVFRRVRRGRHGGVDAAI